MKLIHISLQLKDVIDSFYLLTECFCMLFVVCQDDKIKFMQGCIYEKKL